MEKPAADKPAIIIPAAGMGVRAGVGNPKCLTRLSKNSYAVTRLVGQLAARFPGSAVYLCVGYKGDLVRARVRRAASLSGDNAGSVRFANVNFVECGDFESTTACASVRLALDQMPPAGDAAGVLVCMGDLVLSDRAVGRLDPQGRNTVWGETSLVREGEVGLTPSDGGLVGHLSHGLPVRWAQIAHLDGDSVGRLRAVLRDPRSSRWYFYEALNRLVEAAPFYFERLPGWVIEIDSIRDVSLARYAIERDRQEQEQEQQQEVAR